MASVEIRDVRKSFGGTEVMHGVTIRSRTANSSSWSAPPAAASPPCCA